MTVLYSNTTLPRLTTSPLPYKNAQHILASPSPFAQRSVVKVPTMPPYSYPQRASSPLRTPFLQQDRRVCFRQFQPVRSFPIKRMMPPYTAALNHKKTQPPLFPSVFQSHFSTATPTKRDHDFTHIVHALRNVPNFYGLLRENVPISLREYVDAGTLRTLASTLKLNWIADISYLGTFPIQTISLKGVNKDNVPVYKIFSYNRKDSTVTNFQDVPISDSLHVKKIEARSKQMNILKTLNGNQQITYTLKNNTEKGKRKFDTSVKNIESVISDARSAKFKGASLLVNSVRVPGTSHNLKAENEFYAMKMTGVPADKVLTPIIKGIPENNIQERKKTLLPYLQLWGRDSLAAARCVEALGYGITDQKFANSIFVKDANNTLRSAQIDIDDLTPLDESDITYTYPHRELLFHQDSTRFCAAEKKVLLRMRNILIGLVNKLLSQNTPSISNTAIRDYFKNLSSGDPQIKGQVTLLTVEILKVLSTYYGIQGSEAILLTNLITSPQALLYPEARFTHFSPEEIPVGTSKNLVLQKNLNENIKKIEDILDKMTGFDTYKEPVFDSHTSNVTVTEVQL